MFRKLGRGVALSGLLVTCLALPAGPLASADVGQDCVVRAASESAVVAPDDPNVLTLDEAAAVERDLQQRIRTNPAPRSTSGAFTVPVYWNVLYDQNNPADGNYPDSVITQTINVMNSFFQQVRLSFQVQKVRRIPVSHAVLHGVADDNAVEAQLKTQYRTGGVRTLNIYSVGTNPSHNLAGWATFPWDYRTRAQDDGIVMDYNYLPGGRATGFNTGKIMVHEVGHWVGLLHTFQGGCTGGDYVDDTAPEATAASGCPTGRNTCSAAGNDPIDNMMDYSNDACRVRFTNGQYNRMAQALYQLRAINLY
ncbi:MULTISPECIES: zinc metalloprotease [unclassified Crossiella]|uniref:zinc metalloprotease n=1 Tax=unclassified Crossiella TaxID=2620835 RepID=UPI001FFF38AC|nr:MULTISPECIES: zinc metalloprotease [unclassified Crossiella]MCK2244016.1 zinc metalloprotease [Crossiella sp. S99.2]MCK2257126.1 zinc metalloprotease [Crossiella sp. S99.1]